VAFQDMRARLRGSVPKLSFAQTGTLINDAWKYIRESALWSFNLFESCWITPPPITIGAVTCTTGSNALTFNASAIAAINASVVANPYAPVTVQQFRGGNVAGLSGIYNIITYNPLTGAALLDRIFGDPGGVNIPYTVYQTYYVAQDVNGVGIPDFLRWLSVRNMQMFLDLNISEDKRWVDARDPQRSWYQFPTHVIPWGPDLRGAGTPNASATLNCALFELWGTAITPFTYQCYGLRTGVPLVNPTDTIPQPLGEDLIEAYARYRAYEWCEANRDISPRSSGPNYQFLMEASLALYRALLIQYKRQDRELVNNYFFCKEPGLAAHAYGYYNTIAGVAGPYTQAVA
jgi:hypothetical protein